jgi:hypothetical protein
VANFSASTVPVMRMVRRKSPMAMPAVRMTAIDAFPDEEPARLVFQ